MNGYSPPDFYAEDIREYLKGFSQCGTMSASCKIAEVSVKQVYEWRKEVPGFNEEEDKAKRLLTTKEEKQLYELGLTKGKDLRILKV